MKWLSCLLITSLFTVTAFAAPQLDFEQEQLKISQENAKNFYIAKMKGSLSKSEAVENKTSKDFSFGSLFGAQAPVAAVLEPSYYEQAKQFIMIDVLQKYGISDFAKRSLRALKGKRSLPPTVPTFYYINNTAGARPEVMIIALGATDPDGTIDRMEYTFGDGTTQVIPWADFETVNKSVSHIYPSTGTYTVGLKVVDNTGDFANFSLSVGVSATNISPVPKFTFQYNQSPNFLKVDFTSQATDANGTLARYIWRFGDGSADLAGPTNTTATRTYTAPGVYTVRLQARDNQNAQSSASTNAYVGTPSPGLDPLVYVDANTFIGVAPLTVNFIGDKSFDIDGTIAEYEWNFGDFANPLNYSTSAQPTFKYTYPGTYYASLKVTDNSGKQSTRYFAVYVLPSNGPFTSQILAYPTSTTRSFIFDSSYLALKRPVASYYQIWDFGDGSAKVKQNYPSHTYAANGTYTVTLKIYDLRGGVQTIQKQLVIQTPTVMPPSRITVNDENVKVNTSVTFSTEFPSGVASTTNAIWDFGDGTTQTGLHQSLLNVNHTYTQTGFYPVTLTVTDANGVSSQSAVYVSVQQSSVPANARIDVSSTFGVVPFPIKIDGRSSSSTAGPITKYNWTTYFNGQIYYDDQSVITDVFEDAGDAIVTLYVEDSQGNRAIDRVAISAIDLAQVPPTNLPPVGQITVSYPVPNNAAQFLFDSTGSTDPNSDLIIEYKWNLDGTDIGTGENIEATIMNNGVHTVSLKLTDKWGSSSEVKKSFTKSNTSNYTLGFISTPSHPVPGKKIFFLADEETVLLPGTTPKEYKWEYGDGNIDCCFNRTIHMYDAPGTYAVKLTITDMNNAKHVVTQNVVIESITAPTIKITAEDSLEVSEVTSPQDFFWNEFPIGVKFNLNSSTTQGNGLVDANWNFGDGNTGFGLNPQYTYQKPGVYTVQVTATDSQGQTGTDSMTVTVDDTNCSDTDGIEGCLKLNNSIGHVLPMTATEWPIGHDAGTQDWDPEVGDTEFATLTSVDQYDETSYNITGAIVVDGQELKIQKSALQTMNVDFSRPYKLVISTKLDDASDYAGMFPKLYFGLGTANITTNETGIRLTISGANGYKKYLDLGTNTSAQLTNLPKDTYSVVAQKGLRTLSYGFTISTSTAESLSIDLSSANIKNKFEELKKVSISRQEAAEKDPRAKLFYELVKNPVRKIEKVRTEYPWWAYDQCGNRVPYKLTQNEVIPNGMIRDLPFGTWYPTERSEFFKVTKAFGPAMKLRCSIWSNTNYYTGQQFIQRDGPKRCGQGNYPTWYWSGVQADTAAELKRKIEIDYTIRDKISGLEVKETISTSIGKLMSEQGMTLDNITAKVGVITTGVLPGFKYAKDIIIPKEFTRPEASFTLGNDFYNGVLAIGCAFEKKEENFPRVETVQSLVGPHLPYSSSYNGVQFLIDKFFPADIDSNGSYGKTPLNSISADMYKAKVEVKIDKGTLTVAGITGVKMNYYRNGIKVAVVEYPFEQGTKVDIPEENKIKGIIVVNPANADFALYYVPQDASDIDIEFYPIGPTLNEQNSGAKQLAFTPLFDALKVNGGPSSGGQICSNGFYGNNISAFSQTKLIDNLKNLTTLGFAFRCNDFSLPWGGFFKLTNDWSHRGHNKGLNADVRYFNTSSTAQDSYDFVSGTSQQRKADFDTYLTFSKAALDISNSTEEDQNVNWTNKNLLFNFCTGEVGAALAPCIGVTTIDDLNHNKILRVCQLYEVSGAPVNGCPSVSGYLSAIKRVSSWLTLNVSNMQIMKQVLGFYMSTGDTKVVTIQPSGLSFNSTWQLTGIDYGLWPDGNPIYKLDSTSGLLIDSRPISCQNLGCGLSSNFYNKESIHFNHIHLQQ